MRVISLVIAFCVATTTMTFARDYRVERLANSLRNAGFQRVIVERGASFRFGVGLSPDKGVEPFSLEEVYLKEHESTWGIVRFVDMRNMEILERSISGEFLTDEEGNSFQWYIKERERLARIQSLARKDQTKLRDKLSLIVEEEDIKRPGYVEVTLTPDAHLITPGGGRDYDSKPDGPLYFVQEDKKLKGFGRIKFRDYESRAIVTRLVYGEQLRNLSGNVMDWFIPHLEAKTKAENAKRELAAKEKAEKARLEAARKKREEKRIREYEEKLSSFSFEHQQLIREERVAIGMSSEAVLMSWGRPDHINKHVFQYGVKEQWVYSNSYLYFEDGVLTSFSIHK